VVLALCLFAGAGVRAADDQATVLRTMLGGGVMPTGGKLSALKVGNGNCSSACFTWAQGLPLCIALVPGAMCPVQATQRWPHPLSLHQDSMMAAAAPISAGLGQIHSALRAQYESVTGQLETVVAAAEAQYCTPPTFVPGKQQDDVLPRPIAPQHHPSLILTPLLACLACTSA
jgi:hypothetical protein